MALSGSITSGNDTITVSGTEGDLFFLEGFDVVDTAGAVTITSVTMGVGGDTLTLDFDDVILGNIALGDSNTAATGVSSGAGNVLNLDDFGSVGGVGGAIFGSLGVDTINLTGTVTVNAIDLGNNADVIDASTAAFTASSILMGRGSDQLTLTSDDVVTGVISLGGSLTGAASPGTNTLTLDGYVAQDFIFGGSGADNVILTGDVEFFGMDLGAGDDVVDGTGLTSIDADSLDLGNGNNIANFGNVAAPFNESFLDAFIITSGSGNDEIIGTTGVDVIDAGRGNDTVTGGGGDDEFIYAAGTGTTLTITDFGFGDTGPIDDGDVFNNDFLDLSDIYDAAALAAANAQLTLAGNDSYNFVQGVLLADLADGVMDGVSTVAGEEFDISAETFSNGGSITFQNVPTVSSLSTADQFNVLCFAHGTRIATALGEVPVETLSVGDVVLTKDHGYQTLRWIGERELGKVRLAQHRNLNPILIRKGALGDGFPAEDLVVSPQHRICLGSPIVHRMFGEEEVLVPACKLTNLDGVSGLEGTPGVRYYHLLFEQHELVMSNGTWTESLFLGPQSQKTLTECQLREVGLLFPELLCGLSTNQSPFALRRTAIQKQARVDKLIERSVKNNKSVCMGA